MRPTLPMLPMLPMLPTLGRTLAGLALFACLATRAAASVRASADPDGSSPCGKGYSTESSRPRGWHGLPRTFSPVLDIVLPPLAGRVASMGEPAGRSPEGPRRSARAEWSFLGGAISAVVTAGLAALGTEEPQDTEVEPSQAAAPRPDAGHEGSSPCPGPNETLPGD